MGVVSVHPGPAWISGFIVHCRTMPLALILTFVEVVMENPRPERVVKVPGITIYGPADEATLVLPSSH